MILGIYCAGGLGREIIEFARYENEGRWEEIIFVDDVTEENVVYDARVLRWEQVEEFRGNIEFVIANGEPAVKEKLYNKIKMAGFPFTTIISRYASIGRDSKIGEGCIIHDSGLSVGITIGANSYIGSSIILGHDVELGNHSVVGSKSFVGGGSKIGDKVYIAPCVVIKDRITVENNSILGLGSVVIRNVHQNTIVIGNPAKRIGNNDDGTVWGRFE